MVTGNTNLVDHDVRVRVYGVTFDNSAASMQFIKIYFLNFEPKALFPKSIIKTAIA